MLVDLEELDPLGWLDDAYLERPEAYDVLAKAIRAAGIVGLDSEFYGLDVRKESCVGKARIHVWSVAVRTKSRSPLGFHRARGFVLPRSACFHPAIREVLEDASIRKCVHNQPVDDHAFHNEGIDLKGCINTLDLARWYWPELVTAGGFGLKNLMMVKLGRAPVCAYVDVVNDTRPIIVSKEKKVERKVCDCGTEGCRKRKGHTKTSVVELIVVETEKIEKFKCPLESIVRGHKRFELLVEYAGEDAVAALEVEELATRTKAPAPWPYFPAPNDELWENGKRRDNWRPAFNRPLVDAIVLMERAGIPVDRKLAGSQAAIAETDEQKELDWLHMWYVVNGAATAGPHRREEVDPIWSSPKQLQELFDSLDYPRSPVWKKGKVKPGESKMDSTALGWIGKNWSAAAQVVRHILKLKKIRSSKKYLLKIRDCDGMVYPICGAAGDADDRNGAISGRLGIKGVLELQQLPGEDVYMVRKCIVAEDMREGTQTN